MSTLNQSSSWSNTTVILKLVFNKFGRYAALQKCKKPIYSESQNILVEFLFRRINSSSYFLGFWPLSPTYLLPLYDALKSVTQGTQNVNCAHLQCREGGLQGMLFNPFHSDLNMCLLHLHKLDHFRNWLNWHVKEPVLFFPSYCLIINIPERLCIRTFFNAHELYLALWDKNPLLLIFFYPFKYAWTLFQCVLSSFQQYECCYTQFLIFIST